MTWHESIKYCKGRGAKLIEINSDEENAAIIEEIKQQKHQTHGTRCSSGSE